MVKIWLLLQIRYLRICKVLWNWPQIGRFIAFWATFQSQWQQLFCQNRQHCGPGFESQAHHAFFNLYY